MLDQIHNICNDPLSSHYGNALVNVNSQGPLPPRHTQGILTFEKMCCQNPLYGSKVPVWIDYLCQNAPQWV